MIWFFIQTIFVFSFGWVVTSGDKWKWFLRQTEVIKIFDGRQRITRICGVPMNNMLNVMNIFFYEKTFGFQSKAINENTSVYHPKICTHTHISRVTNTEKNKFIEIQWDKKTELAIIRRWHYMNTPRERKNQRRMNVHKICCDFSRVCDQINKQRSE